MKRLLFLIILLMSILAIGCQKQEDANVSQVKADYSYEYIPYHSFEGEYTDHKNLKTILRIYRVTEDYVWFSFHKELAQLSLTRAKRIDENTYEFHYSGKSNFYKAGGKKRGKIQFAKKGVLLVVEGRKEEYQLGYKGILFCSNKNTSYRVCNLEKCLDNYYYARESIYMFEKKYIQIGKEKGTSEVKYVEVNPKKAILTGEELEKQGYRIGDISFFSTIEECDAKFGKPIRVVDGERYYSYKEKYEVVISFERDCVQSMGIYLENKKQALGEYAEGDFTIQGCRIVKYNGNYNGKAIQLPNDIVGIAANAFRLKKSPEPTTWNEYNKNQDGSKVQKITIHVPKRVYLEPLAFSKTGPLEVTFEEGRTEIEPYAFYEASVISRYGTIVTLPKSLVRIRKSAFEQSDALPGVVNLTMNDGVKQVDARALRGVLFDRLPEGLEQLGDECIYIKNPKKRIVLPRSLKKLGWCVFEFGTPDNEEEEKNTGVEVEKDNPHFKSDKEGWLYSKDGSVLYFTLAKQEEDIPSDIKEMKCEIMWGD